MLKRREINSDEELCISERMQEQRNYAMNRKQGQRYQLRNKEKSEEQQIINPLEFCLNPTPGKEPKISQHYQISALPQYQEDCEPQPGYQYNLIFSPERIESSRLNEYLKFARILISAEGDKRVMQNQECFLRNLHLHNYDQRRALKYIAEFVKEDRVGQFLDLFEDKAEKQ